MVDDLLIEVKVEYGHVTNTHASNHWTLPDGVSVHVFDYYRGCPDNLLEPDDQKGERCRQTIYVGAEKKNVAPRKVRVYLREGTVFRIIMPPGSTTVVTTFHEGKSPETRRWVCKRQ